MKKAYPYLILIFLGLILGNYFFAPKEVYLKNNCKLQDSGHCQVENENYQLDFKISPLPINPLQALSYEMTLRDKRSNQVIEPKAVNLRILGHDMNMPEELYFPLEKIGQSYSAKRIFPTCTEELMTWRLYLSIDIADTEKIKSAFDLLVAKKTL